MGTPWFLLVGWILLPFSVFRIARMLAYEDGPFEIFFKFRYRVGVYDLAENEEPKSFFGKLFSCPLCVGVWVSLLFLSLLLLNFFITDFILVWFGIAGVQTYIQLRADV